MFRLAFLLLLLTVPLPALAQDRLVVFRCDQGVDKQVFEPVLAAISKAGGVIAAVGEASGPKP